MTNMIKMKSPGFTARSLAVLTAAIFMSLGGNGYAAGQMAQDDHSGHGSHAQMNHAESGNEPTMGQQDDDPHAHHKKQMENNDLFSFKLEIPQGLSMENQYGEQVDLLEDVIGDRVAVIDFVYTTCTTVCPVVSSIFTQVQDQLGNKMENQIALITITVDPARDTSHRLLSYSKNFNPGENWSWLTGKKKMVDRVNTLFGAYTPVFEDHPAMVLVGDAQSSDWYRYIGFPAPDDISRKVNELLKQRNS